MALKSPRFVVSINGQQRCVAGFEGYAVLSAGIDFVRSEDCEAPRSELIEGTARIHVGGLQGREHVEWLNDDLYVGDEVRIRVLEGVPIDTPSSQNLEMHTSCSDVRSRLEARRERLAKIGNIIPSRFEVLGNGELFCTAGVETGVLSVMMTWVRHDPTARPPHISEELEDGDVDLHVGGLENDEHLDWFNGRVDVGDEVTVRILGHGPIDPPEHRRKRVNIPHEEQIVVSAARITLRKLVPDDLEFVTRLLGNPQVMRHVTAPLDHDEAKQWLERHIAPPQHLRGMFLIVDNESKTQIGIAGILEAEVEEQVLPVVQCLIDPSQWRQKYATDAAWIVISMTLDPPAWSEFYPMAAYALIRPGNEAGLALARKFGMKLLRSVQHQGDEYLLHVVEPRER